MQKDCPSFDMPTDQETQGTRGGPGGRERTLAVHISSSRYAKILGKTNFQPREFPRSGSKAKDGKERKRERLNDGNNKHECAISSCIARLS